MTSQARIGVFVLGLAAAVGWYAGVALLPLAAWVGYEAVLGAIRTTRTAVSRPL